ncbi:variant erythrocyte surface antigen-1 family protein [Babesia caballi]|uniref:Variant erythrocyte surface antigen-1 family protein n=1 Tax=Babesia caballi TaxID=5871 RepID=A0AAV4LSB5_BABCB|nr:variant erythrocyte surface antigen-1 family protein [Babesia caballi]
MASKSGKSLTDCPSNLKEAIDWILRVTGKDRDGGDGGGTSGLFSAVHTLISNAEITELKPKITITQPLIESLATGLAKFIGYQSPGRSNTIGSDGIAVGQYGRTEPPWKPEGNRNSAKGYVYTYDPDKVKWSGNHNDVCARIFLGCVPLCFYGLTYLYWRCHTNGGGWSKMYPQGDPTNGYALKNFMGSAGFDSNKHLKHDKKGADVVTVLENFNGFSKAVTKENTSFTDFLKNLRSAASTTTDSNPLSALFLGATFYFETKRSKTLKPPSTIRQMLYWLSGLAITPQFGELLDTFSSVIGTDFHVAVSGSSEKNEKLSANDLAGHLVTSCISSSWVLGTIQGSGTSEPLLHDLFCNSVRFAYPSGPTLFYVLSNYAYALQFQLSFLYQQCAGTYSKTGGWKGCKYGATVNSENVTSHICSAGCSQDSHNNGNHSTPPTCKHKECEASPLQAFLTDTLKGFSLSQTPDLSSPNHLDNHPPGTMCHVPMGFTNLGEEKKKGSDIYYVLRPFCSSADTPIRQLSEKLGCLTKRTPRTLGDVFGFLWHLNDQLFHDKRPTPQSLATMLVNAIGKNNASNAIPQFLFDLLEKIGGASTGSLPTPTVLSRSFETMVPAIPFLYQLFMVGQDDFLPTKLFDLTQHCHKWESDKYKHESADLTSSIPNHNCSEHAADLWSLYRPVYAASQRTDPYEVCRAKNCGGYLAPLSHTHGATFSPSAAPAYLSWMAYLTDVFYEKLSEMRDDFNNISCEDCHPRCANGKSCHATSGSACSCASVVQCAGVLPLLYRCGFNFTNAYALNGWKIDNGWQRDAHIKRDCQKFSQQLSNVLSPDAPLAKLLETIDSFLYLFRFYFFYNLSTFWLCSLAILLYFLIYGIDVLHFKSHVRFPSSHELPPIGLLTTGKAPALTKLTYYMP